jgi:hypothetical protein
LQLLEGQMKEIEMARRVALENAAFKAVREKLTA